MNHLSSQQDVSFLRIPSTGKAEEVVRRLIEAIDLGIFSEGGQLPSEAGLASQFGVATVTVREALSLLRAQGFVETRRGRKGGSFVTANFNIAHARLLQEFRRYSVFDLRDYGDERAAISGHAARLAAERATADDLDQIAKQIRIMEKAMDRSDQRRADMRFHVNVAMVSQSVRLTQAEMQLQSELGMFLWIDPLDAKALNAYVDRLKAIEDAIARGDGILSSALSTDLCKKNMERVIDARLRLETSDDAMGTGDSS
ncbi:FadR/GntR family transcriptional regulator [Chromohalobacter nigrandesensis]|uniref:FadR/GntR family transcriptional regulator n=1 Tax=Chromohalobacter nigrandesensis TaxID=119863 RepID=UPI001FF0FF58|nr:FCD domain-containing protein [Chromohalobacter nigrandesensis]MCK0745963.1 FCD domain-containing protein [Chromohalobacter nigrandesensis]